MITLYQWCKARKGCREGLKQVRGKKLTKGLIDAVQYLDLLWFLNELGDHEDIAALRVEAFRFGAGVVKHYADRLVPGGALARHQATRDYLRHHWPRIEAAAKKEGIL